MLKRACESRNNTSCGSAPLTFVDDTNTQINLNFKCVFKYSDQTKNNIPGCRIENDVWQSYIYNKYQESDIDAANCGKPEID